jgi:S1-C subfamily serine protease
LYCTGEIDRLITKYVTIGTIMAILISSTTTTNTVFASGLAPSDFDDHPEGVCLYKIDEPEWKDLCEWVNICDDTGEVDSTHGFCTGPVEPLILANSSEIRQGQQVFAIGSPFLTDESIPNTVTSGIISEPVYTFEDEEGKIIGGIASDVPTVGGNSGGPILNMDGKVIGMIVSGDDDEQCCSYAIPSNAIEKIVPVLIEDGNYSHPRIGLTPQTLAMSGSAMPTGLKGVGIYSIDRDGPANEAGLKVSTVNQFGDVQMGDIITAIDGKPITTTDEFEAYIDQNKMVGEDVDLTIYRNGTIVHAIVTLK